MFFFNLQKSIYYQDTRNGAVFVVQSDQHDSSSMVRSSVNL